MNFNGKVILITGASSGIGADCARHLADLGGKVAIVGRNEKRLTGVAEEIKKNGSPEPLAIVADITVDGQRIIDETIKHFGQLDVLVNNAGIVTQDSIVNFKIEEFDRIFNTNVRSVATLTSLAVPHLEKTKGNIVNVSSVAGLKAVSNVLSYCMSKSSIDMFTRCCALDLASKNIRVNAINPSVIRGTTIFQTLGISTELAEKHFELMKQKYPVGRVGEVSDTSAAIAYLASDLASFITGTLLPVDGGSMISS